MNDKRAACFAALLLSALLAACAAPAAPKTWTRADMVVGFLEYGSEGAWRAANRENFRETAQALGITLKLWDSAAKLRQQDTAFRYFLEDDEINVIVLTAADPKGWEAPLQEAKDAGKIVILQDRRVDAPEDLYAAYVGSDFVEEGRKAALEMCALLGDLKGKKVWELAGTLGSSASADRGRGFRGQMEKCGIEITKSRPAGWMSPEGKQVTEDFLAETHDVQGIFAQNDDMGLGAIEALKDAGLRPGVDVKIVSVDATSAAFDAMLAGDLNATVECNPLIAPQVYAAALAALNGETLPKWIPSQEAVFRFDMPGLAEIAAGRKY